MKATKDTYKEVTHYRVNSDVYGNPRYVIHFKNIADDYEEARRRANSLGGRVYTAHWFGGGFVFQSYNIAATIDKILKIREEAGELDNNN